MRSALSLAVWAFCAAIEACWAALAASASTRVALASTESIEERSPATSCRRLSTSPLVAQPPRARAARAAAADPAATIFRIFILRLSFLDTRGKCSALAPPRHSANQPPPLRGRGSGADLDRSNDVGAIPDLVHLAVGERDAASRRVVHAVVGPLVRALHLLAVNYDQTVSGMVQLVCPLAVRGV